MTFARFSTAAALVIGLTGAASALPLMAPERPAAQVEQAQWRHGHQDRGHHDGWRHHGPRCWTERIVHRTPWGPRVDYRRVCR
jgi:hypothetical protein